MSRTIPALAVAAAALSVAACGSGTANPSPSEVKAKLEHAAHVALAATPVDGQDRKQGLVASFSNEATAERDHQALFLFVTRDAGVASHVREQVRSMIPRSGRLVVKRNVLVLYAAAGNDHGAQVQRTVEGL